MRRNRLGAAAVVVVAAVLAGPAGAQAAADSVSPELIAEGRRVFVGQSGGALCFSCHGMNAKGMPGIAPDLTDGTWLHGDGGVQFLSRIVKTGVAQPRQSATAMPPMGGAKLTDAQLNAVAAYIASLNRR